MGGTVASLEELAAAGRHLETVAGRVGVAAGEVSALTFAPALVLTAWRSPFTAAAAERALVAVTAGPRGLVAEAVRLGVLAEALRHAVDVYRAWDEATRLAFDQISLAAGRAATAVVGPGLLVGGVVVTVVVIGDAGAGPEGLGGGADPADGGVGVGRGGAGGEGGAGAGGAGGADAGAGGADGGVFGVAGVLLGLLIHDTRALEPFMAGLPGAIGGVFPVAELPWGPPTNLGGAAGVVAAVASLAGVLREPGRVRVGRVGRGPGDAPRDLAGVLGSIRGAAAEPTIRVTRLDRSSGGTSWIVAVPGTRTWQPRAGPDPFDLTGDVRGIADQDTAAREAVLAAMKEAGVRPGEPVLLAGYSQGGIVAGSLAADPDVRRHYAITHVVTAGAPIGGFDLPPDVQVLSLENDEDPVPRLEGRPNPDEPSWTTVSRDIETDPTDAALLRRDPLAGHRLDVYARTAAAAEADGSQSVVEWRRSAAAFFDGPGVRAEVIDVAVTRQP